MAQKLAVWDDTKKSFVRFATDPAVLATSESKTETVANAGTFTTPTKHTQIYVVSGTGGAAVTTANAPFGSTAPTYDGAEIWLICSSDTATVTIPFSDTAKGCLIQIDVTLYRGSVQILKWVNSLDRYIDGGRNQVGV